MVLRMVNVAVAFGDPPVRVLDDICLTLHQGEFVSLVGPSGCGKSTILRLIGGLLTPSEGRIEACGPPSAAQTAAQNGTSFVFQQPNLLPWRNVLGNVALPCELAGAAPDVVRREAEAACHLVGLDQRDQQKLPKMLSGGMQMRASLARALITRPALMLMDEPFAAIDDILRHQLNRDVLRLWQEQGWSCVFVTHHLHEAVYLAQRIIVMSDKPGRFRREFLIPFPYPRKRDIRTSVEFARILEEVDASLREK
jgi:NitT/TauT family transport system ATP-binding protein